MLWNTSTVILPQASARLDVTVVSAQSTNSLSKFSKNGASD